MRANHDAFRRWVAPGERHVKIGRRVVVDAQPEALRRSGYRGMSALLAGAVWIARDAWLVQPIAPQLVEQYRRQVTLLRHRRTDIHCQPRLIHSLERQD